MTVIPLNLPAMEVEGRALEKLAELSFAALKIPELLESGLNRPGNQWEKVHDAIAVMQVVEDFLEAIEAASPGLVDTADVESATLFELQCALTRVHLLAFGRVRSSRMFIRDLLIIRDNEEIRLLPAA